MVWVVYYLSVIHFYLSTFNFLEIAAPVTMVRCCILMLHTYVYMCWCVCVCVCVCVFVCVSIVLVNHHPNTSVLKLKLANMPYLTIATACVCVRMREFVRGTAPTHLTECLYTNIHKYVHTYIRT